MTRKTCLIIAPLDPPGARIADTVSRGIKDAGMLPVRVDRQGEPGVAIVDMVLDALEKADLVIADVSRQNPNVMYELGFAQALRKPTLTIINREAVAHLPADLAGSFYLAYDEKNLSSLRQDITRFAGEIIEKQTKENRP